MARIAEKKQIYLGKAFITGNLIVKNTESKEFPILRWGWHVAPVAYVKQPDGKVELTVFDPSLFKKPVTVKEWENKMMDSSNQAKPSISSLYYGTRFQNFTAQEEGFKGEWKKEDLELDERTLKRYLRYQEVDGEAGPHIGKAPEGRQ
jgi:hypothetical protein